jgi:hypothetical protein
MCLTTLFILKYPLCRQGKSLENRAAFTIKSTSKTIYLKNLFWQQSLRGVSRILVRQPESLNCKDNPDILLDMRCNPSVSE